MDNRKSPQIPTTVIVNSVFAMFVSRLGSLNALEQLKTKSLALQNFIEGSLPSADTIGRVVGLMDSETIRGSLKEVYTQLKRSKCLELLEHGLVPLIFDGHESHATYRRHCSGCLKRTIHKGSENEKIQYYHRQVTAQLWFRNVSIVLDAEPQLPDEDEVTCAIRLFERLVKRYPRAFDVVIADALYCVSNFFNKVIESGKDVIAVLKDERRDLMKDAESHFNMQSPKCVFEKGSTKIECWDAEGFQSWPQVVKPVRVVKTRETKKAIRRQLDGELEEQPISEWMWVMTISKLRATTQTVIDLGHGRWRIENDGFNELVNDYFSDHVYKHEPRAMLNFLLLCFMSFNVFHCFYHRNLKVAVRVRHTMLHIASEVKAELYCNNYKHAHAPP